MGALETSGPLLDLAYGAPSLGPINVCKADLGQAGDLSLKSFSNKYS